MLTVLLVGGRGRSRTVAAGVLLRTALAEYRSRIAVGMVGSDRDAGGEVDPEVIAALTRRGAEAPDIGPLPDRPLRPVDVQLADLVLTMEREHRARVVEAAPEALRRTFCLREFAALVRPPRTDTHPPGSLSPGGRFAVVVDSASDLRGIHGPPRSARDDAVPPIGRRLPLLGGTALGTLEDAVPRVAAGLTAALTVDHDPITG